MHKNKDAFHIILPGLDQCLIVVLGLFYVDRPKFGGSLIIFFSIMGLVSVAEDRGSLIEALITLYSRWRDGHLRYILLSHFPCASNYNRFIVLRGMGLGKAYLMSMALHFAPPGQGWDLLFRS